MRWVGTLALAVAMIAAGEAHADRIFVSASSEEQGHAWLFGGDWDGRVACWIAVPRHVARERGGDGLLPLNFVTSEGRSGDTATPFWIGDVPGAVEAAAGQTDLAFARVNSGGGDCRSRLGLPDYAYKSFMASIDQLTAWSMSPNSYGPFSLRIDRASMADGGGVLRLAAATPEEAERYMTGGISGSVAEGVRNGAPVPVAMVLQVDPDTRTAIALRFDRLRAAFELVEDAAKRAEREERASVEGVPMTIDEVVGIPLSGSSGPTGLLRHEGCFRAAPNGGQRAVDILVSFADGADSTKGAALASGACGEPGLRYVVEQRTSAGGSWAVVRECVVAAELPDEPNCRFESRAPRQFRLRILGGGPVALAALQFY